MKITTHIRNYIFVLWENSKTKVNVNIVPEGAIKATQKHYKKKNSWIRNQVTQLIKKVRKEKPYEVGRYSEARQLYESLTPIDLSKVKEGSYVCKISKDAPKKVGQYEYYVSYCLELGVFQVGSFKENWDWWNLIKYNGDLGNCVLNFESERAFRFATKEEIKQFKIARKNYKQKKKEIEALQKQISKLYKQL